MRHRLAKDLRHAARGLRRDPVFTAAAVLSLAIGIGANATIFSAASGLLLSPMPAVRDPHRLVDVGRTTRGEGFDTVSYRTYADLRDTTDVFDGVFAHQFEPRPVSLGGPDGAERIYAELVSASFFEVLGVTPAAGVFFRGDEEQLDVPLRKVVLSHGFWRRRFAADSSLVGGAIVLNGDAFVVSGVAPAGFQGTTVLAPDIWVPLTSYARSMPQANLFRVRENVWLTMGARLKPSVSLEEAQESVSALAARLATEFPDAHGGHGLVVAPTSRLPGQAGAFVAPFLGILLALAGLVLLVACANLAGLLLARAATRTREMAVRLALGASRAALARLLIVETLLLFVAGAAGAGLLARWTTAALAAVLTSLPVPVAADLSPDWRALLYTAVLALATGLATSLVPAWQTARLDLRGDLGQPGLTPRRRRLRQAFVAAQIAGCFVLVAVAGLFLQALHAASTVDTGLAVDRIDVASLDLSLAEYPEEQWPAIAEDLRARFGALPGVEGTGTARMIPLSGSAMGLGAVRTPGDASPGGNLPADWNVISPGYLTAVGVPVLRGRDFTPADRDGAPEVAIVNASFARLAWPERDPIGRTVEAGDFRPGQESIRVLTVVGVTPDTRSRWIGETPGPFIYVPLAQNPMPEVHYFLRREADATVALSLTAPIRAVLRDVNPNLPLISLTPFRQYADLGLLPQRLAATIAGLLGGVALLLAAIGVYGVVAHMVASRTREIGVRVALGADRSRVRRLVFRQGVGLAIGGNAAGLAVALGAAQLVRSLLFGVSPADPMTLAATFVLLTGVAFAACLAPARRASRLNPIDALKAE